MPKLFGLNVLGLLAGSIAFNVLGVLWYGTLFTEQWHTLKGIEADPSAETSLLPLVYGFINVLVVTLGVGLLLKWLSVSKLLTAIKYGLIVGVCFALTTEAYGLIYGGEPLALFMID
ncbi:MAG: DUF1761 domain-containing protein, partial [Robiginitomaculum sp.]|nr:DUF1761 domain-containing protein [Robiginitomaculum sp.]